MGMLDSELKKIFKQDWDDSGKVAMLDNMLEVTQKIFDALFPINIHWVKLFDMRQVKKEWTGWSADYGDVWEEGQMSSLSMDALKSLNCIRMTDNTYIKDELLKIKPEMINWREIRRVGREAQGRITAKAGRADSVCVNKVGTDNGGNDKKKQVKCFRCNRRHFLQECKADKTKMK